MSSRNIYQFVLTLSSFIIFLQTSNSRNYYISPLGADSNNGLTPNTAFKTIQTATNIVRAGDSVLVLDGYYSGFDHRDKNSGSQGNPIVYLALGKKVWITSGFYRNNGINIENNDFVHIIGFKIHGMLKEGIRAVLANNIKILNNECDSCFRGIFTGYTDDITIEHNICTRSHGEHGIYVSNNSDRVLIRYNSSSYNKASGIQINPDVSSGTPGYSEDIICTHNIVFENRKAAGLNFQGLNRALIANNLIYNNHEGSGITLFHGDASKGCSDVKIFNNTIFVPVDGRWCIHIVDDSKNILINNNILINLHPWKGAIALDKGIYSQEKILSDYNLVSDKFCEESDGCSKNLKFWQSLGNDIHSILVPSDLNTVFKNINQQNFELQEMSPAINSGSSLVYNDVKDDLIGNARPQWQDFDIGCYEKKIGTLTKFEKKNKYSSLLSELLRTDLDGLEFSLFDFSGKCVASNLSVALISNFPSGWYTLIPNLNNGEKRVKPMIILIQ
ncbi:MAG: right-handed parallel beta-helix repeat-containing protein [Saprospiraceae bacterium]|nr:right-handed parallel beta-helix repeat-containing protein [Saprospiraceae bacterium]HRG33032.1 right-handed parallel beta-helix repeat-containing protein [Saprospiraceae bacterium]